MESAPTFGVLVGEVLGRYRVVEPLGEGSMATVYAGEHVVLGHQVAIKIMHPEYMRDSQMERRLLREARALAAIRHPGIVQLVDIGRGPGGRAYIIMELLQGQTLAYRLRAGALPERYALLFARQIASALAAAHAHGIVHRDLKPENVFIVGDPAVQLGERAKIIDFGISKRTPLNTGVTPPITRIGVVVGTPEYMSPEQCAGDDVDERSDIYSLGVVMYQMATGILPFVGSTGEVIAHHRYVESPRPRTVSADVSEALDRLITRCLAKKASDRFQGMNEIVDALDRIDSVPALRDPDTDLYRLRDGSAEDETDPRVITLEAESEPPPADEPAGAEALLDEAFAEATYDLPPPRRYEMRLVTAVGAALAFSALAVVGFALMRESRSTPARRPAPAVVESSTAARREPAPVVETAPPVAPAVAADPAPVPEVETLPPAEVKAPHEVAALGSTRPRAEKKDRSTKVDGERRRRPPAKSARADKPKENFTDVVTPTVF